MDPISFAASITALIQLTSSVLGYINDVNDGREERISLRNEISSAYWPLQKLHELIEPIVNEKKPLDDDYDDEDNGDVDKLWLSSVMELGVERGPIDQYKSVLKELQRVMEMYMAPSQGKAKRLKAIGKSLAWPFKKDDVERYLKVIERQKTLFLLALQNDNL
jgi:hypothetical protein